MANNKNFVVKNGLDVGLNLTANNVTANTFIGALTGNASTATTLATSRTISLGGDLSGSASFNGSADVTITATVADDSHNHVISNIDNLQTALDGKVATTDIGSTVLAYDSNLQSFVTTFTLPTTDGTTGQALVTNGSGTISFANAGATDINGLSDGYSDGSSVGLGSGALANDDGTANENVAVGINAGNSITSGYRNVIIGSNADGNATATYDSVIIGRQASALSRESVAIGSSAKAAVFSTSIGYGAHATNGGGNSSVAIGRDAGRSVSGFGNLSVSNNAGRNITTGTYNQALGYDALYGSSVSNLTGSHNTGIGYQTGYNLSTGAYNFLGGYQAGYALTTGSNNVAIGNGALDAATTGGRNIAIGQDAMGLGVATAASGDNIAIGYQAGYDLTSGTNNFLGGLSAGSNLTTGAYNVAIGNGALSSETAAIGCVAIGYDAARTEDMGVAIGYRAGNSVLTADVTTTAIGYESMGDEDDLNVTGSTAVGYRALFSANGANNTAIGNSAGSSLGNGTNNILLGNNAQPSSATVSNEITLGNSSITRFRIPGIQAGASNGHVLTFDSSNGILSLQALPSLSPVLFAENPSSPASPTATGANAVAIGNGAESAIIGKYSYSAGRFVANGDAQSGKFVLRADTTGSTPEALTTNNSAASTTNQIILPNNSAYFFSGTIVARQQAADGTAMGAWEVKGAIRREGSAGTTVLVNSAINAFSEPSGWSVSLTADTTNGGLAVTVTGPAATDIRWVADINTTEVTYA